MARRSIRCRRFQTYPRPTEPLFGIPYTTTHNHKQASTQCCVVLFLLCVYLSFLVVEIVVVVRLSL